MDNRTGTPTEHLYDVDCDWDNTDITEHGDGGYSLQFRATSPTDPDAFYVIAIRLADGTAIIRSCNRDLKILSFRVNDDAACKFVAAIEDNFLVPHCGIEALQDRTGYQNRRVPCPR